MKIFKLKISTVLFAFVVNIEFIKAIKDEFSLKAFLVTVLNDVIFLNKTQMPININCKNKLNVWHENLISTNPAYWSLLGSFCLFQFL